VLPSSVRILVCTARQDMRRSFDTLAAVVRDVMGEEPQSGALYVGRNGLADPRAADFRSAQSSLGHQLRLSVSRFVFLVLRR
jgi:hypothetical protein